MSDLTLHYQMRNLINCSLSKRGSSGFKIITTTQVIKYFVVCDMRKIVRWILTELSISVGAERHPL